MLRRHASSSTKKWLTQHLTQQPTTGTFSSTSTFSFSYLPFFFYFSFSFHKQQKNNREVAGSNSYSHTLLFILLNCFQLVEIPDVHLSSSRTPIPLPLFQLFFLTASNIATLNYLTASRDQLIQFIWTFTGCPHLGTICEIPANQMKSSPPIFTASYTHL